MTDLLDYQFELGDVVFGYRCPVATDDEGFDPGSDEPQVQDIGNPFTSSYAFGEDSESPASWIWALHTDTARFAEDALEDSRELALAWKTAVNPRDPGAVAALRYQIGGRTRVVYGRPRRFAPRFDNGILFGLTRATAEFQRADTLYYADDVQSVNLTVSPVLTTLGFETPIITPLTTLENDVPTALTTSVDGDIAAPFTATINGPDAGSITNPRIYSDDWELQLVTSIEAGESVEISTYPWGMKATRDDGANLSGYFSAQSRLSKARLKVGSETIRFDGIDSSGTATASISWRAAYSTI